MADFRLAFKGDTARMVRSRRRGAVIGDILRRLADGGFVVLGVVVVLGLDGDFVSGVFGGEDIALASCACDRIAVAQPLVFDAIIRYAVAIFHLSGERASHLGIARDGDGALLIDGRRRAGRIITCEDFGFLATYMQFTFIERTDFRPILHGQGSKRHFASLRIQGHAIMWFTCSPASLLRVATKSCVLPSASLW